MTRGRGVVVEAIAAFIGAPPAWRAARAACAALFAAREGLPLAQPRHSALSTRERRKVSHMCSGMCGSGELASSAGKGVYLPRAREKTS